MEARDAIAASGLGAGPVPGWRPHARYGEQVMGSGAVRAASVVTAIAIVVSLVGPSLSFFREVPVFDFLFGTEWAPTADSFGVLGIVLGPRPGAPCGLSSSARTRRSRGGDLPERVRAAQRPYFIEADLEVLATGVPDIVFSFIGFIILTPPDRRRPAELPRRSAEHLQRGRRQASNWLLIVPIIASISEDAMSAVPRPRRGGVFARHPPLRVALRVVFPAAL